MISINDLKNTDIIIVEGTPFAVLSVKHQHIGRGGATVTLRIKNIKTGQNLERNYKSNEEFEEGEIEKIGVKFLYNHRGEYWFTEINNPKNRIKFDENILGEAKNYLKPDLEVVAMKFEGEVFGIELPIKVDYKVIETPPGVKGNTASGGTKTAVIESGAKVSVPLFVNEGDVIRVNTATGEYAERVEKG